MFHWFRRKKPASGDSPKAYQACPEAPIESAENPPVQASLADFVHQSNSPKSLSEVERLDLQIQVRRELEEKLRPEIEATIQSRCRRELLEASQGTLLKYLVNESGQDADSFYADLPKKTRAVLDSAIRRQITPKIEEALRTEMRDKIRIEEEQKLREELVKEMIKDPLQIQVRRELEEQLRPEIEATIQSKCRRELLEASQGTLLKYLVNESGQDVESFYANLPKKTRAVLDSAISRQITPKVEQALRTVMRDKISVEEAPKLREELVKRLKIQVSHELEEQLRPEIEAAIQSSHRRELVKASQGTLLKYLVKESGQDAGSFYANLPKKTRAVLDSAMRLQMTPKVEQALRIELRHKIWIEEAQKIREELFIDMIKDPHWQSKAMQAVEEKLTPQVQDELREKLKPEVEAQLARELSLPVVQNVSGRNKASIAAVIQQHLETCKDQLHEQVIQKIWLQLSSAIVEAFGAASTLDDDSLDDAMIAALDAHETVMLGTFDPRDDASVGINSEDGVRKAVEAALTSLGFMSNCGREHWQWYCSRAKAFIDKRVFQSSDSSESMNPIDGFYRAIQSYICDRTGRQIEPGDFYLVFGGLRIALPMTADPSLSWSKEESKSAKIRLQRRPEAWPAPNDKISPSKVYRRNP